MILKKSGKFDVAFITIILILFVSMGLLLWTINSNFGLFSKSKEQANVLKRTSGIALTPFDTELTKQLSGRIMIGYIGSQHIHADWKIYINGKQFDLSDKSHMERMQKNQPVSNFIHVDSGAPSPEKTGDVLHMHATGIPLWIFFKSIGIDFNKECIVLENKEKFCNSEDKKLKFLVNWEDNEEFENHVFNDLDKILITYGNESEEEITNQLKSITDFARIH